MLTLNFTKKEPKHPRQNNQSTNSILYSAALLGAVGGLIAPEAMVAEAIQTFVLPQGYRKTDDGRVLLQTQVGQPLYLTDEQYVILDDGLLLVTDELAQNTMQSLPVMGALRANGLLTGTPLASGGGGFIETTTDNLVWTGGRGPIQDFGLGTYQLAQAGVAQVAEETVDTVDTGLLLGSGVSLIALVSGLFGATVSSDQTESETADGGTGEPPSGGGGGTTFSGTVIKGPLVNAFVFFDENGNGVFDAGEPNFTTSSTGGFSISSSAANPKLIVTTNDQTIDTTTGTILSGLTFKSPVGASIVSPLTTMMEESGLTVAQIKSVTGLPATVNPLTFNPYAPGVNPADALAAEQVSAQTMVTLAAFAAAAAGTGISQHDAFAAALSALSSVMQSKNSGGGTLDLTHPTDLAAVQSAFTTAVGSIPGVTADQTTAINGIIGDATTAIQNVNNKIASITNADLSSAANGNIFGLLQVLQDQVEKAAEDEKTTPGSGTIGFTDPTAVDNAAINSAPTDIDLSASSISEDASSLVVGVLTTTDDSTSEFNFTYEIAEIEGSNDHSAFSINQANGELSFVSQPDFETKSSYTITIIATDEGGKSFSETFTITVINAPENQAPTVTGVAISGAQSDGSTPKAGTLVAGDKILVTVTVDENITVDTSGGTPQYTIDVGGVSKTAAYVSGSGGTSLVFAYEVQAGDFDDAGGITSDTSALDANSGTLKDADGHDLDLTTIAVSAGANTVGVDATNSSGSTTITLGEKDEYSASNGNEASPRTAAFDTVLSVQTIDAYFDDTQTNSSQGFSFDLSNISGTITGATLKLSAKPLNDSGAEDNDVMRLWGSDPSSGADWATYAATGKTVGLGWDAGPNNYFNFDWRYNKAETIGDPSWDITLDLSNFAAQEGTGLSLISDIDQNKILNVLVGDDTIVDYAELDLSYSSSEYHDFQIIKILGSQENAGAGVYGMQSGIGDTNSDGFVDIAISEYGVSAGLVHVFFGSDFIGTTNREFGLVAQNSVSIFGHLLDDKFGHAVDKIADLNGDGAKELIVSSRDADPLGRTDAGSTYVIFDTPALGTANILDDVSLVTQLHGASPGDLSGWSVSAISDLNGDDLPELVVGAGFGDPNGTNSGEVYIVSGALVRDRQGSHIDLAQLGNDGLVINGISSSDHLGAYVNSVGDIDGNGTNDLMIAADIADPNGDKSGSAYLLFGEQLTNSFGSEIELSQLSANGVAIHGASAGDQAGIGLDWLPDIDGDGKDEIVVGSRFADSLFRENSGSTFVIMGSAVEGVSNQVIDLSNISSNVIELVGAEPDGRSGFTVRSVADLDGDGLAELAVGSRNSDPFERVDAGMVQIVSGSTLASATGQIDLAVDANVAFTLTGENSGDLLGYGISIAGDVNADGLEDLAITAPRNDSAGLENNGATYLLSGRFLLSDPGQIIDLNTFFSSVNGIPYSNDSVPVSFEENSFDDIKYADFLDPENDLLNFDIVGGIDQTLFDIDSNSGVLTFKSAPDYETPADNDKDNVYEVQIQASDGNGGTAGQTVSVTVSDVIDHVAIFAGSGAYGDQKSVRAWDVNGNGLSDLHVRPISGETSNYKFIIRDDQIHFDGKVRIISDTSDYSIYGSVNSDRWSNSRFGSPDINADGLADLLYTSTVASELVGKIQDESNFLAGYDLDLDAQISGQTFKVSGFGGVVALAANVGDLDGDSRHEIIIVDNDYLYLIEGSSLEAALGQNVSISDLLDDGTGGSRASYSIPNHGSAAAGIGDRNNDGVADFLVGQPYGSIDIISAAEFLSDDEDVSINNSTSVTTLSSYVPFGYTAEAMPDVDNDGTSELLISAGRIGHTSGSVFVVFGSHINDNFGTDLDLDSLDGSDGVKISGTHNSWFGNTSTFIDDLDGDGMPELVVSSPEGSSQEYGEGAVYVIYGNSLIGTDGHLNLTDILNSSVGIIEGSDSGNMFGHNMDVVGDLTGDGLGEIAIGGETVDLGYSGGGIYVIPSELIPGPGETLSMSSFSFEII